MNVQECFQPAKTVLELVKNTVCDFPEEDCKKGQDVIYVYTFHNGRENGFKFTTYGNVFIFVTEHRNSDQIRLTVSNKSEWGLIGRKDYEKSIYFDSEEERKAAEKIIELLDFKR